MKNSTRIVKYKSRVVKSNASSFDICCASKTSCASYTKIPFSLNPITQEVVKTCKKTEIASVMWEGKYYLKLFTRGQFVLPFHEVVFHSYVNSLKPC